MPSKLRKAIRALKDQTSIGLAHISRRSSSPALEVAVLKATSHDELPADDRRLTEVVLLASSSPAAASAVAAALRRRISRTRSWAVALKSLSAAAAALSDSGPDFRPELAAHGVLDLSLFSDASSASSPWDFTAFVRTYALYLDARLQSSLAGHVPPNNRRRDAIPADARPPLLLERLARWQRILDRALGTRPTGPARASPLVRAALRQVALEARDLYRNVSRGLSLLLSALPRLPRPARAGAHAAFARAAAQFEELDAFFACCRSLGVGGAEDYPDVQRIPRHLLRTLEQSIDEDPHDILLSTSTPPPPLLLLSNSCAGGGKFKTESSPSLMMISRTSRSARNPFLDDWRDASPSSSTTSSTTTMEARKEEEEEVGRRMERDPFARSRAWARRSMDAPARQRLAEEQQMWLQHQNKMIERSLLGW